MFNRSNDTKRVINDHRDIEQTLDKKYNHNEGDWNADEIPIVTATVIDHSNHDSSSSGYNTNEYIKPSSRNIDGHFSNITTAVVSTPFDQFNGNNLNNTDTIAESREYSSKWDENLKTSILTAFKRNIETSSAETFLTDNLWPKGLQLSCFKTCKKIPIRFFVVDDSGSMSTTDGQRILKHDQISKVINCTRWSELNDSLKFHIELSGALGVVSEFRFLNTSKPILIGINNDNDAHDKAVETLNEVSPSGQTPLCFHISSIVDSIIMISKELKNNNQKACVIICTDGLATDGDIVEAMRPLTRLPVWVVIRLCTSDNTIVDFWNSIDKQLEIDMDVIDDLTSEAAEVKKLNSWLTYSEALHRFREFGCSSKELDYIDESTLGKEQMRDVCSLIFVSNKSDELPHPDVDWFDFVSRIRTFNTNERKIFCPIAQKLKPWIDIDHLQKCYDRNQMSSSACSLQ